MNIKRIKVCTAIITAIILVISGANISQAVQASEDSLSVAGSEISELTSNASTTVSIETETTTSEATSEIDVPRPGDKIWINEEKMVVWDVDQSYKSEVVSEIKFEIYILDRYDEERWRIHIPFFNVPERVLLIPVDYDITVIEHNPANRLGDLTRDGKINGYDMILMRRALFRDYDLDNYNDIDALMQRSWERQLADVNSDKEISVADLVCLSNFLLGKQESFR